MVWCCVGGGGVGAAGDCRDHHVAIADVVVLAFDAGALRRALLVDLFEVGVEQLVDLRKRDAVLRTLGAGERGHDGAEIEFEGRGEDRLDRGIDPEALFLGIGFDQRDLRFVAMTLG